MSDYDFTEHALEAWGNWLWSDIDNQLGYSRISVIWKMMRYGEMVGEGRCCFETQEDLLAETINGIVLVLRAVKPKQAKALKVRYKYQTLLNLECAKRAKMDEDIFNYSLKAGKRHVKDALKEIGCG